MDSRRYYVNQRAVSRRISELDRIPTPKGMSRQDFIDATLVNEGIYPRSFYPKSLTIPR